MSFITISAFTVIYVKHKNRLINIDIERSEKKLSNELNEHKRLLDIKAQLIDKKLTDSNIKRILGMEIPEVPVVPSGDDDDPNNAIDDGDAYYRCCVRSGIISSIRDAKGCGDDTVFCEDSGV